MMADLLYYLIGLGLVAMAAITAWVVTTPGTHLFVG
jgi:hypothetical protein